MYDVLSDIWLGSYPESLEESSGRKGHVGNGPSAACFPTMTLNLSLLKQSLKVWIFLSTNSSEHCKGV